MRAMPWPAKVDNRVENMVQAIILPKESDGTYRSCYLADYDARRIAIDSLLTQDFHTTVVY